MLSLITILNALMRIIIILDFKSVLAYSTVSQLSIMFIGLLIDPVISFNHMSCSS